MKICHIGYNDYRLQNDKYKYTARFINKSQNYFQQRNEQTLIDKAAKMFQ